MRFLPASPKWTVRRGIAALVVVCALVVASVLLLKPGTPSATVVEIPRDQLVLSDGLLCSTNSGSPFTGIVTEAYPDGSPMSRSVVVGGKLDGLSEGWHTNGVKQVEERFLAGVSHGLRTKWHPNGQKASEANILSGRIDGLFRRWHDNGQLAEEITLRADRPHGPARAFYPSGFLKASAVMVDGKPEQQKFWDDGQQRGEPVLAGLPNGVNP